MSEDDYWTNQIIARNDSHQVGEELHNKRNLLTYLDSIEPLDRTQEATIPPRLASWILDDLDGSAASLFAIIDATGIVGLEDRLISSELEHRCLFIGDAFDNLRD